MIKLYNDVEKNLRRMQRELLTTIRDPETSNDLKSLAHDSITVACRCWAQLRKSLQISHPDSHYPWNQK